MHDTKPRLLKTDFPELTRRTLDTLQVNLGYICNQSCNHCHVNAGPKRTEIMTLENINHILQFLEKNKIKKLDLTGGAPELNPHFRYFISQARALNVSIIDRCNLTILSEPNQNNLAEFLAENKVEVVASLPCYSKENVDKQRGKGVFDSSIIGLQKLNALGYGKKDSDLLLNLMYNPNGAFLPPSQQSLETEYKQKLHDDFNITFNQLLTLTNMPIMRFGSTLVSKGEFENYIHLLKSSHSNNNLETVMCKNLISIDWQGFIYDCDFNQMLDMPSRFPQQRKTHIAQLNLNNLQQAPIQIGEHCYGCTAGSGSSCGGALS
ncbi:Possible L-Asparaginase II [hydrothermal vent metagenome]|uniref:Possible L-Asparaginase II n=1 Tax=hydrothermal vent metagenome TaxID=652676 RepID=A0A3B0XL75_9ZZZZ